MSLPAVAAVNIFDQILSPLRGLNIARLYQDFAGLLDFAFFLILFLGVGQIVFMRLYPGKGGKALTVAVGIILAVALAVAEETIGFRLVSVFGPIASAMFIGLVGVALYQILVAAGANKALSGSATYILLYLSFTGIAPTYFNWLNAKVPLLGAILALGMLAAFVLLIYSIVRQVRQRLASPKLRAQAIPDERTKHEVRALKDEKKKEKHVAREERKAEKDAKSVIKKLKKVKNMLSDPRKHGEIRETLQSIFYEDKELHKLIDDVGQENLRLRSFDVQEMNELKQRYSGAKLGEEQELFKAEMKTELRRLKVGRKVREAEIRVESHLANFDDLLKLSVTHLQAGETDVAKTVIGKAIEAMRGVEDQLEDLRKLNHTLIGLGSKLIHKAKKQERTSIQRKAA